MVLKVIKLLFFVLIALGFSMSVSAQESVETFGKNRVQHKILDWKYYNTDNFDVYFYTGGKDIAKVSAEYLESEYNKITDVLGYQPYTKIKIFLYNSVADLQQSNVGVNENNFTIGGQTNFVKAQVEIAYPGTISGLKEELVYKVSKMLINDMMFGGSITDMFQSGLLLSLPDWFTDGGAKYFSKGWDVEMDDYMRDLFQNRKFKKLSRFEGHDATLVGQSIWNYIAETYGKNNISYVLNLTRIIRDEEKGISNTLGVPFKKFLNDWQKYYTGLYAATESSYKSPMVEEKLQPRNRKGLVYSAVKISPGGSHIAFVQNNNGKSKIIVKKVDGKKKKTALISGYKVINQEVDYSSPIISWKDEHTLGIINVKSGKNFLWIYDINNNKKFKKELGRFNQIKDFSFSSNGKLIVLSGDIKGKSDIFIISLTRNGIKRITNDIYDDVNPKFIPNTKSIVFSSNRTTDTIAVRKRNYAELGNNYNLFIYNLDTTRNVLSRASNTLSKDIKPLPKDKNTIYYLSDQKGISNLYKYGVGENIFTQVSNFNMSIKDFDIDFESGNMAYVMVNKGRDFVFYKKGAQLNENIFTPQTKRQEGIQAKFIAKRLSKYKKKKEAEDKILREQEAKENAAKIADDAIISTDHIQFDSDTTETDVIDTDNYVFDQNVEEKSGDVSEKKSFLLNYRKLQKVSKISGPLPYEPRFSADNLLTSWVLDPLRGFGVKIEAKMNDMLENHRFYGGLLLITDLRNNDIFAEYQFLKHRIDFGIRYDRNVIQNNSNENPKFKHKYSLNKFEVTVAYPFSVYSRVSVKPFFAVAESIDFNLDPAITPIDRKTNFVGAKVEFVYDNTVLKGLNLFEGTRGKVSFTHFNSDNIKRPNFSKLVVDVRNYQKIHKVIIFASRFYYGRFFGKKTPKFLLGGMDNWMFSQTNVQPFADPLTYESQVDKSDLLFVDYVTNLRGFDYNKFNGENALLINAELRFPLIKYLAHGPVASNFLRNLQFIGFYDIGSSWNGSSLLPKENTLNREIIKPNGSPFEASIDNFNTPWLSSYGVGMRTVILGYYMKFDLAWPIEDYKVNKPRFYLTLGYDF